MGEFQNRFFLHTRTATDYITCDIQHFIDAIMLIDHRATTFKICSHACVRAYYEMM